MKFISPVALNTLNVNGPPAGLENQNGMIDVGQNQCADGHQFSFRSNGLDGIGSVGCFAVQGGADQKGRNAEVAALTDLGGGNGVDDFAGEVRQKMAGGDHGVSKTILP